MASPNPADLTDRINALKDATATAADEQLALNAAVKSAGYQAAAADLAKVEQVNRRIANSLRDQADIVARRANVRSGGFSVQFQEEEQRRRRRQEVERQEQAARLERRHNDLISGRYARDVRQDSGSRRAERMQQEQERAARIAWRQKDVASGRYEEENWVRTANDRAAAQIAQDERTARLAEQQQYNESGGYARDHAAVAANDAEQRRRGVFEQGVHLDERRKQVGSGQFAADHEAERNMEIEAERVKLAERRSYALSGGYTRELGDLRRLRQERESIDRLERRAGFQEKYGNRLGGAMDRYGAVGGGLARAGERAGMMAGGSLMGAVYSGFSGTVEWERFNLELQFTTRELAGAFRPALMAATDVVKDIRGWLERLSPNQQKWLGRAGVGLAGTIAVNGLARGITGYGLGGLAMAAIPTLRSVGMSAASMASSYGPTAAAFLGSGRPPSGPTPRPGSGHGLPPAVVVPGRSIGARVAGAARFGLLAPAVYTAYHAVAPDDRPPEDAFRKKHFRTLEEQNPEYAGLKSPEEYDRAAMEARKKEFGGLNFLGRRLGSLGAGVVEMSGIDLGRRDDYRPLSDRLAERGTQGSQAEKNRLTLAGGGYETQLSGYDRIQQGLLMTGGAAGEKDKSTEAQEKTNVVLDDIKTILNGMFVAGTTPGIRDLSRWAGGIRDRL